MSSGRASGAAPTLVTSLSDTPVLVKAGKVMLASYVIWNPSNAVALSSGLLRRPRPVKEYKEPSLVRSGCASITKLYGY